MALALLLVGALLTIAWRTPAQTSAGLVAGRVTNGTAGADVPVGLEITLHVFSGMEESVSYTATVSSANTFQFSDVVLEEGQTLVARTVHQGVAYVSEFATVATDQQEIQLPITIYEVTDDSADVAIVQLHLFVSRLGEQLQIGQYCLIGNAGDRTFAGRVGAGVDQMVTWQTLLPEGATALTFDGAELGGRYIAVEGGFADTRPLLPGEAGVEASYSFDVPYRESVALEQSFDVPVDAIVLVLLEGDLALEGVGLSQEGQLDTQMGPAASYTAGPLASGEPLAFSVVSRPAGAPSSGQSASSTGLALGLAAVAAAGVVVYWMWRPRTPGPVPQEVRSQVQAIVDLDREFESGLLPEAQYRPRRASLKDQIVDELAVR
jgi:hypothetical protein